jgi:hypothetical protein
VFDDVEELRWKGPGARFPELAASFDAAITDVSHARSARAR